MSNQDYGHHVGHYACPSCGSADNLSVYLKTNSEGEDYFDGSCWSPDCSKKYWRNNELIEAGVISGEFQVDKTKLKAPRERITKEEFKELSSRTNMSGKMKDGSQYRGLADWVLKFYGHRVERKNGEVFAVYYPETYEGKIQGFKSRHLPKKFGIGNIGKTGNSNDLSGQHKFTSGGRSVVIVAGEEDKCAAQQMFREYQISRRQEDYDPYAVVSPVAGEGSAAKQCAAQYEFLDSFDSIVVCMDNDEAGEAAAEAICKVLPKDKVKVMKLSGKDVNEMLLSGRQKQFISNFFEARELVDSGIKDSVAAMDEVREFLSAEKITLPPQLHRLQEAMRGGIRSTGAIVSISGETSSGKSFFTDNLVYHWIYHSDVKPTIVSLERTAGELTADLYSIHLQKNLVWFRDGMDAVDYLDRPDVMEKCLDMAQNEYGEPRYHIIDERTGDVESLKQQVDRTIKQYGSRLFLIDPQSDLGRHLPLDQQEKFFAWQKQLKKEGVIFINVLHTRKHPAGSNFDKNGEAVFKKVTEYDTLGSSSAVQSADINIVINRNKMATCPIERNTTIVDMPKCRGGHTGTICELYYDAETRQQYDKLDYFAEKEGIPTNTEGAVPQTGEGFDVDF